MSEELKLLLALLAGTVTVVAVSASIHGDISNRMRLLTKEFRDASALQSDQKSPSVLHRIENVQRQVGIFKIRCWMCAAWHIILSCALVAEVGIIVYKFGNPMLTNWWIVLPSILLGLGFLCYLFENVLAFWTLYFETKDVPSLPRKSKKASTPKSAPTQLTQEHAEKRGD
jgi:hypothetical protein